MKKVKFSFKRIPAFAAYTVACIYGVSIFTHGEMCLWIGALWYLFGLAMDPNFQEGK